MWVNLIAHENNFWEQSKHNLKPCRFPYMGTNARYVGAMSKAVAAELRAELARNQCSIRSFAAKHALPLSTLHKNVSGKRAIDVEDLYLICDGLGISISSIIARAERAIASSPAETSPAETLPAIPEHITRDDLPALDAVAESDYTQLSEDEHTP